MSYPFKAALCLAQPPGGVPGYTSGNLLFEYKCQRRSKKPDGTRVNHAMPHRSRWQEWNDGDREARIRPDKKEA